MVDIKEATEKGHFTAILIGNSLGWIVNTILEFLLATISVMVMYSPLAILLVKVLGYSPEIIGATLAGILIVNYTYALHNKEYLKEIMSKIDRETLFIVYLAYSLIILIYTSVSNYLYTFTNVAFLLALFWFSIDAWLIDHELDKLTVTGIILTILSKLTHANLKDYSLLGGAGFTGFFGKLQNVLQ